MQVESERIESNIYANFIKHKKDRVAVVTSDRADYKAKNTTRSRRGCFLKIRVPFYQKT